jgi:hypothetical protein
VENDGFPSLSPTSHSICDLISGFYASSWMLAMFKHLNE